MTLRETLPILGFLIGAVLVSLFVTSNVVLNFLVFTLILAIAAQGWNLLGGYGGQYSFGHAAFFGMGAYVSAILQQRFGVNAYPAVAFGIAAAALLGYAIGAMVFRAGLRGSYFALVTLAFAEVLRIMANAAEITGGAAGLLISLNLGAGNLQFANRSSFLILAAVLLAGVSDEDAMAERGRVLGFEHGAANCAAQGRELLRLIGVPEDELEGVSDEDAMAERGRVLGFEHGAKGGAEGRGVTHVMDEETARNRGHFWWSPALIESFDAAIHELGGLKAATPAAILQKNARRQIHVCAHAHGGGIAPAASSPRTRVVETWFETRSIWRTSRG